MNIYSIVLLAAVSLVSASRTPEIHDNKALQHGQEHPAPVQEENKFVKGKVALYENINAESIKLPRKRSKIETKYGMYKGNEGLTEEQKAARPEFVKNQEVVDKWAKQHVEKQKLKESEYRASNPKEAHKPHPKVIVEDHHNKDEKKDKLADFKPNTAEATAADDGLKMTMEQKQKMWEGVFGGKKKQ